jgi:HD-like signal output (HDOD) protein
MKTRPDFTLQLDQLLSGTQLPALPQSAIRLLELSRDPDNGPAECAVPIESDPGLTSQVLRFVNSSYFGFAREISSVKLAITLVGIRTIKNFALWSAVFSLMPNPRCGAFDLKSLWKDSLRRGLFARAIGRYLGLGDHEDLFSAALLQDMALPLLARELPEEYSTLLEARAGGQVRISQLERKRFGWTHANAAATMARSWNLPDRFIELMECHTELERWMAAPEKYLDRFTVSLSALLPASCDSNWWSREQFDAAYHLFPADICPGIGELFTQIDREFEEFAPVLKLAGPNKSLLDELAGSDTFAN